MIFQFADSEYDSEEPIITGRDLKKMRIHAKVTTSVAAEYMGVKSRKTIENWESGQTRPKISQLLILCRYYDMDASKITALCLERMRNSDPVENFQDIDVASCSTAD